MPPLNVTLDCDLLLSQRGMRKIPEDDPNRRLAEEISNLLGGSPLRLNQAAGLMKLSSLTFEEFLDMHQAPSNVLGKRKLGED